MSFVLKSLLLFFVSNALSYFPETKTLRGVKVHYISKSNEEMTLRREPVASARLTEEGAFIYYNYDLFEKLSLLSKKIIIEHERAHHRLGHTYSTKIYRDKQIPIPAALIRRKEADADCESGYRLQDLSLDLTREQIQEAVFATYEALVEIDPVWETGSKNWIWNRVDKVATCYEGELIERPKAFEVDEGRPSS